MINAQVYHVQFCLDTATGERNNRCFEAKGSMCALREGGSTTNALGKGAGKGADFRLSAWICFKMLGLSKDKSY